MTNDDGRRPVWRWAGLAITLVFAMVLWGLIDAGDSVSVFSVDLPAWLLALLAYLGGALALWVAERE